MAGQENAVYVCAKGHRWPLAVGDPLRLENQPPRCTSCGGEGALADPRAARPGDHVTSFLCSLCHKPLRSPKPIRVGVTMLQCPHCGRPCRAAAVVEGPMSAAAAVSPPASAAVTGSLPATLESAHPPRFEPTPAPRSPALGKIEVAGYAVLEELGRGAMGVVYRARHERLKRIVALKTILIGPRAGPPEVARFHAEAEAIARLHHPNVIQIYEISEQNGRVYLALEFVGGGTLKARLQKKVQPPRAAAQLVETLARAVQAAHERGVVHRDLKPANILLATPTADELAASANVSEAVALYGIPRITDFGLAKRLHDDVSLSELGAVVGTPAYMAPEQAAGRTEEVGPSADIYALGAILYEMLTARLPFEGKSIEDTLRRVAQDAPVPPRRLRWRLPRNLQAICLKCLEKDPRHRYRTALALADDLQRFLKGEPVQARPAGWPERLWRWSLRNPVPASLLVTVTLLLAFGLWGLSSLSNQMVEEMALEGVVQQTEMLRETNKLYTQVTEQMKGTDMVLTHLFDDLRPRGKEIPIPIRFTILLGEKMEKLEGEDDRGERKGRGCTRLLVYSNHPFRKRPGSPPKHRFGIEALKHFAVKENREKPFYRFEDSRGSRVLRYGTPLIMGDTCKSCHNDPNKYENPQEAKTDWNEGDVRGVLEIIRPLDEDIDKTRKMLTTTYELVGGGAAGLLLLCALVLTLGRRLRG